MRKGRLTAKAFWITALCLVTGLGAACAENSSWYAGKWDSSLYVMTERPKTVALRVEVVDADSHMPVESALVEASGVYREQGRPREFRLQARTGRDGIAVLSLLWNETYTPKSDSPLGANHVGKVDCIEVRHRNYRFQREKLPFQESLGSQDAYGKMAEAYDLSRVVLLELGEGFGAYGKRSCDQKEFFKKVRDEEYARELNVDASRFHATRMNPQVKCGPYLVLPVEVQLEWLDRGATSRRPEKSGTGRSHPEPRIQTDVEPKGANYPELPSENDLSGYIKRAEKMEDSIAITALKAMPMVDPQTGKLTTLEGMLRGMAEQMDAGGDLAENPVATAYMMLSDTDYLMDEARIVRIPGQGYTTLQQAMRRTKGKKSSEEVYTELRKASETLRDAHGAASTDKYDVLKKVLPSFSEAISRANAKLQSRETDQTEEVEPEEMTGTQEKKHTSQTRAGKGKLQVKTLTDEQRKKLGLPMGVKGAVVSSFYGELAPGDVIESLFHRIVRDREEFWKRWNRHAPGGQIMVGFWHRGQDGRWERDYEMVQVKSSKATYAGRPGEATMALDLGEGVKMELVLIPAGEFMMGSENGHDDEQPVHRVRITEPFYMSTTEVTQEQYEAVMGEKPWSGEDYAGRSEDAAANYVSWNDAQEFCEKLSEKTNEEVRLPTEAQWEYACRAGSETAYCFGDSESRLGEYGWYDENSGGKTHPVARKKPNAWGLYDMHGNVWEWCRDWYDEDYYSESPTEDPKGPSSDGVRVLRGGSWSDNARDCRSADRDWYLPTYTHDSDGFRVVWLLSPRP